MFLNKKRYVSIAASTVLLSLISSAGNAQNIDVFSGGFLGNSNPGYVTDYTFSSSMILNSIGFYPSNDGIGVFEFAINGGDYVNASTSSLGTFNIDDSAGVRWFQLSNPITLSKNATVSVRTNGVTSYRSFQTLNTAANVDFVTSYPDVGQNLGQTSTHNRLFFISNSNLRVSPANPGSNVAPEPGTFALALTGGGALLGICIRRRRNAA